MEPILECGVCRNQPVLCKQLLSVVLMQVIHQQKDWALVLQGDTNYMVRHLVCGAYLRFTAHRGCVCKGIDAAIGQRKPVPVETEILKMFQFLTGVS